MRGALDNARFLHRDISVPNIILVQEPGSNIRRGYLIDWDVASIADKTGVSLNPGRTVSPFLLLVLHPSATDTPYRARRARGASCRAA